MARMLPRRFSLLIVPFLVLCYSTSSAHGGVVGENDVCVINIGYLKAHFKIFVPQQTGHTEYCEDIPVRGESVFIMEYQHGQLSNSDIEFRIIRNVTGKSKFARAEDVAAIDDLDKVTVHYSAPGVSPDLYSLLHTFEEDGEYIGIVSAADANTSYAAVFPFEVGSTGFGIWPWVVAALIVLQLNFWYMSKHRSTGVQCMVLFAVLLFFTPAAADEVFTGVSTHFSLRYDSEIKPITINKMHYWDLEIRNQYGNAVEKAKIRVSGGMPAHNHGLPSAPRVVEYLGDGRYRIGGMRFHMGGYWELRISIDDGNYRDTVIVPLTL